MMLKLVSPWQEELTNTLFFILMKAGFKMLTLVHKKPEPDFYCTHQGPLFVMETKTL